MPLANIKLTISKAIPDEVLVVPPKVPIYTDKKTGVKSVSIPFQFPDGVPGFVTVTRLVKLGWDAGGDIESITIKYK